MNEKWDDVRVRLIRPNVVDPDGACANAIPQDDDKVFMLHPGKLGFSGGIWTKVLQDKSSTIIFCAGADKKSPYQFTTPDIKEFLMKQNHLIF